MKMRFSCIYKTIGIYTRYEATISQEMILLTLFQLSLACRNHTTILRPKYGKVTFQRVKNDQKWTHFVQKNISSKPFVVGCLRIALWFRHARESQNKVRSTIFYDIVASYHVYTPMALQIHEKRIFICENSRCSHLCDQNRQLSVDQKVNIC